MQKMKYTDTKLHFKIYPVLFQKFCRVPTSLFKVRLSNFRQEILTLLQVKILTSLTLPLF